MIGRSHIFNSVRCVVSIALKRCYYSLRLRIFVITHFQVFKYSKFMDQKQLKNFYIVGIGASAGGLEALESFFDNMPPDSNLAFVVVQHLSPDYKSMMVEILSKRTDMPVIETTNEMLVQPNHIYLIPRKKILTLFKGRLYLVEKETHDYLTLPIDIFFHSLAQDQGQHAIAIVLSGTGSDGTRGIRTVKEADGMVMVQREDSARFDGMPRNAIATGLADYILSTEEMPGALLNYIQHPHIANKSPKQKLLDTDDKIVAQILGTIKEYLNVDFSHYKMNTVLRRIERRMSINQLDKLIDYLRYLYQNPTEVKVLYKELLIGVTKFFRDHEAFETISAMVLPKIFEHKLPQHTVRVWVAGCSTGEEAYSLGILFAEYLDKTSSTQEVKIFATDIDSTAIDFASAGVYPDSIVADVSVERLKRFFIKKEENKYEVNQRLRKMVIFAPHDLIKNPPFNKIDLLSCRNLFIYFQSFLQEKILRFFHFSLKPHGFLFIGSSETIGDATTLFSTIDNKHKIYQYKTDYNSTAKHINFETSLINVPQVENSEVIKRPSLSLPMHNFDEILYDALIEEYIPPSVIINENFDVLHIHGDLSEYLQLPQGKMSVNLSKMLDKNIAVPFNTAIHNALKKNKKITYAIQISSIPKGKTINLHVKPLTHSKLKNSPWFVVTFEEVGLYDPEPGEQIVIEGDFNQHIIDLERELQYTRETLQAALEEVETSNEELQATNEELLASNEELQSTNEELQAVNEELITVNVEHQRKIQELTDLNDDVNNLLRNTHIGTIFLDQNLCVKRFTPEFTKEFNMIDGDIGRPFEHISHNLKYDHLLEDVQTVLLKHGIKKVKVANKNGDWYLLQISPYIVADQSAQGIVLTLVNYSQSEDNS